MFWRLERREYQSVLKGTRSIAGGFVCGLGAVLSLAWTPCAHAERLDRGVYGQHLRAMWMGECIANWTGIGAEGMRQSHPFLTDAEWGSSPFPERPWVTLGYYYWGNPWNADDDTDIEYVYLHLLHSTGATTLSPEQIAQGWTAHINRLIWVSNDAARKMMTRGVLPPMTGQAQGLVAGAGVQVDQSMMIDAQLTTELFGALCPGMPGRALELADLPIRTTAHGHAVHAAQFYVVLYSLASRVDRTLSGEEQCHWLAREAQKFIPESSKASEIVDFVLADYLANPDKNDWTVTRDAVYQRYVVDAASHGYVYRQWYESSVNFALGVTTLLYGRMEFERTIRIGTLGGFDCDNQAATMGGLVALVRGPAFMSSGIWVSDRYHPLATRDNLPDYLPSDAAAEDTFTLMAARSLAIVDRQVLAAGGRVDQRGDSGVWLLPPAGFGAGVGGEDALQQSPTARLDRGSVNNTLRRQGASVAVSCNVPGSPQGGYGSGDLSLVASGHEHDFRGLEDDGTRRGYYSTQRAPGGPGVSGEHAIECRYPSDVNVRRVRFIAGDVFTTGSVQGGWFASVRLELLIGGEWKEAALSGPTPVPNAGQPFAIMDFVLAQTTAVSGVRVIGEPGGASRFVTCAELDAFADGVASTRTFDLNADGAVDAEDVYAWRRQPRDFTGDGVSDAKDQETLIDAARWLESSKMSGTRRE